MILTEDTMVVLSKTVARLWCVVLVLLCTSSAREIQQGTLFVPLYIIYLISARAPVETSFYVDFHSSLLLEFVFLEAMGKKIKISF